MAIILVQDKLMFSWDGFNQEHLRFSYLKISTDIYRKQFVWVPHILIAVESL